MLSGIKETWKLFSKRTTAHLDILWQLLFIADLKNFTLFFVKYFHKYVCCFLVVQEMKGMWGCVCERVGCFWCTFKGKLGWRSWNRLIFAHILVILGLKLIIFFYSNLFNLIQFCSTSYGSVWLHLVLLTSFGWILQLSKFWT